VTTAAREFIDQLDGALALVRQSNTDYLAAAAVPSIYNLYVAVAELDCWPIAPVLGGHDASSGDDMSCS
jgi:hypothetical protein